MKRLLSLTLLLGALFGLLGQQSALAAGAGWQTVVSSAVTDESSMKMASECMEMMDSGDAKPMEKPCTGLTLDCIAAMGCVVPVTLANDMPVVTQGRAPRELPAEAIVIDLVGREIAPEPEPPTLLI